MKINLLFVVLFVNIFAFAIGDGLVPRVGNLVSFSKEEREREKEYDSHWVVKVEDFDAKEFEALGFEVVGKVADLDSFLLLNHKETQRRHQATRSARRSPSLSLSSSLSSLPSVVHAEQQTLVQYYARAFNDPIYGDQWHLKNTGQFGGEAGIDLNVEPAWALGFTGSTVQIAIVDDGFQHQHPDLSPRYQRSASRDFNDNDNDPSSTADAHGTSCGGNALAAANNGICGVGVAYNARAAGIRLTAAPTTDATTAQGLSYQTNANHIYSNSWGPSDDGVVNSPQGRVVQAAIANNAAKGRNNRGSIYTWAGGNGGDNNDNSNYDGYANNRYVIAVGAVGNDGKKASYSENGANLLIVAPSLGNLADSGIRTTDLLGTDGYDGGDCTSEFSGTSAATPFVAGVVALMLDAKPLLSWRDVQFILATTARKTDLNDSDWATNGAGYQVNHKYGFGLVDAHAAVLASQTHQTLSAELTASNSVSTTQAIPDFPATGISTTVNIATDIVIERVLIEVTSNHPTSGDLQIVVTSPAGTRSVLSEPHGILPGIQAGAGNPFLVGSADFGPSLTLTKINAQIITASPSHACNTITNCNALNGKIAAVDFDGERSGPTACDFIARVTRLQNCGAKAMAVFSSTLDVGVASLTSSADRSGVTIPSVVIPSADYKSNNLGSGPTISLGLFKASAQSYASGWTFSSTRHLRERSAGTWTVTVTDGFSEDTGSLSKVSISVFGSDGTPGVYPTSSDASSLSFLSFVSFIVVLVHMF